MKKTLCIFIVIFWFVFALSSCMSNTTIEISDDGYWVIDGEKTDVKAEGEKGDRGEKGDKGASGTDGKDGVQGNDGLDGESGKSPTFKIESGELKVSYDNGTTWTSLGNIQGADAGTVSEVVFDDDGNLLVTMSDGTVIGPIELPKNNEHVHTFEGWTTNYDESVTINCEKRFFYHACKECEALEWKIGSYDDHIFTTVTTPPTCVSKGYDTKTCSVCGKSETLNETAMSDHSWCEGYSYNNSYHWFACEYCDANDSYEEHNIDDSGYCTVCGQPLASTEGIMYDLSGDGTYAEVIGYYGTATRIVIADTYKGVPVTNIYKNAFKNKADIVSVIIPNSVTSIGYDAFAYCVGLASVEIGNGVTSIGESAFYNCRNLTSVVIPNSVTAIGEFAFSGCQKLESVTFPDGIISMGIMSFGGCNAALYTTYEYGKYIGDAENPYAMLVELTNRDLSTYTIHKDTRMIGYGVFNSCERLSSITIPDGVTTIGESAFENCSKLTSVTIPDSVTAIGYDAFYVCPIENATIPASAISKIQKDKLKTVIITSGDSVGQNAFSGCTSLTSITIPSSVTSIGSSAFKYCTSLTSVTIPSSVTTIGSSAFSGCASLECITLPFVGDSRKTSSDTHQYPLGYIFGMSSYEGGIKTQQYYYGSSTSSTTYSYYYIPTSLKTVTITGGDILYGAFYNCSGLTSVVIGDSVTSIGNYAFEFCTSLTSVTIPNSVTSIGSGAFYYCSGLKSITIPSSVTSIGSCAFENCTSLTSVTIPDSVTTIASSAFENCTSLASITIPNSVTTIGDNAFMSCDALTSIVIPNSVISIGSEAFLFCRNLVSVTIGSGVTSIGDDAFASYNRLVEVINKSSLNITAGSTDYGYVGYWAKEVHTGESKIVNKDDFLFITSGGVNYLVCYAGNDCDITLPESYNGDNYKINEFAFYDCSIRSVVIPDAVIEIGDSAFFSCYLLTGVTIGNGVTKIGNYAFSNCCDLTDVTIGSRVTSIGIEAFSLSSSIESIKYRGTVSQWNSISKGTDWNLLLSGYTITYNYSGE